MHAGRPIPLPGADLDGFLMVGCDPALGLAAGMLPQSGPRHLIALSGSTAAAVDALRAGRAHGALVHNTPRRLPTPPRGVLRLHLARWRVGLATRGPRVCSLDEICARRVRVVQREDGASSQKAFVAAITRLGSHPPDGPRATGHLEVARRVSHGAPAGVTMEPAALSLDLAFEPLEEHVAELWFDARWRDHPAVDTLAGLLRSTAFTRRLALVGGYETGSCGSQRPQRAIASTSAR
jgi:molybdate-binding protein